MLLFSLSLQFLGALQATNWYHYSTVSALGVPMAENGLGVGKSLLMFKLTVYQILKFNAISSTSILLCPVGQSGNTI